MDHVRPLLILQADQYIDWNEQLDSADFWHQLKREAAQGYDANILCVKQPVLGDTHTCASSRTHTHAHTQWSYASTDSEGCVNVVRAKEVSVSVSVFVSV